MDATNNHRFSARHLQARELGEQLASKPLRDCEAKIVELRRALRTVEDDISYGEREGVIDDSGLLAQRRALKEQIAALETERSSYVWHPLLPRLGQQQAPATAQRADKAALPPQFDPRSSRFMAEPADAEPHGGRVEGWIRTSRAWTVGVAAALGSVALVGLALHLGSNAATPSAPSTAAPAPRVIEAPLAPAPARAPVSAPVPAKTAFAMFGEQLDALVEKAQALRTAPAVEAYKPIRERLEALQADATRLAATEPDAIGRLNHAAIRIGAMTYRAGNYEGSFVTAGMLPLPRNASLEQKASIVQMEISALELALDAAIRETYTEQVPEALTNLVQAFANVRQHVAAMDASNPLVLAKQQAFDVAIERAMQAHVNRTYRDGSTGVSVIQDLPPPFTAQAPKVRFSAEGIDAIRNDLAAAVREALAMKTGTFASELQITTTLGKLYDRTAYVVRADSSQVALLGQFNAALSIVHGHTYVQADRSLDDISTPARFKLPHDTTPAMRDAITKVELDELAATVSRSLPGLAVAALASDLRSIYFRLRESEPKKSPLLVQYNTTREALISAAGGKIDRIARKVVDLVPPKLEVPAEPVAEQAPAAKPAAPTPPPAVVNPADLPPMGRVDSVAALERELAVVIQGATALRAANDVYADGFLKKRLEALEGAATKLGASDASAVARFNAAVIRIKTMTFTVGSLHSMFSAPPLIEFPRGTSIDARVAAIADEVGALDAALQSLREQNHRGMPDLLEKFGSNFGMVRSHIAQLNPSDRDDVRRLIATFDASLQRARTTIFLRSYDDGTVGKTVSHALPTPIAGSAFVNGDETLAQRSELKRDIVAVVSDVKSIQTVDKDPDAAIRLRLAKLHDRIIVLARADSWAASLIADYNAALITIRAHTYKSKLADIEVLTTPVAISIPGEAPPAVKDMVVNAGLKAIEDAMQRTLPEKTLERMMNDLNALNSPIDSWPKNTRNPGFVERYNALREKMARAAVGKTSAFWNRPLSNELPRRID